MINTQQKLITVRRTSAAAEALIGKRIDVGPRGYVTLVDYMGTDRSIVEAARVSYGRTEDRSDAEDKKNLRYMMSHRHTSPFEMCEIKILCDLPIFSARQMIRHRTASVNEASLRYSEAADVYFVPPAESCAPQSASNKQGREEIAIGGENAAEIRKLIEGHNVASHALYEKLAKELGLTRELARIVLPVSLHTRWIWKIDVHNLLHFLGLRCDPHAQKEIREFANAIASIVQAWLPWTWEAFVDYRMSSTTLSRMEGQALANFNKWETRSLRALRVSLEDVGLVGRELTEGVAKISRLLQLE